MGESTIEHRVVPCRRPCLLDRLVHQPEGLVVHGILSRPAGGDELVKLVAEAHHPGDLNSIENEKS